MKSRTAELEQLNHQLQQTKQQLEATTAAKTRFFAAASHDLMQPFNAAALFCGLIRQQSQQDEVKQLAQNLTAFAQFCRRVTGRYSGADQTGCRCGQSPA